MQDDGNNLPVTTGTQALAASRAREEEFDLIEDPQYVARLKVRAKNVAEIRAVMMATTSKWDWLDQDGKPYLKDSGIQKVRMLAGVEFSDPITERLDGEDAQGKWTSFKTTVTAYRGTRKQTQIGFASTRDPFFAIKHRDPVPYEKINLGNVEKKSITNAQHNALTKFLGLGGFTWEELKEKAGIDRPTERIDRGGSQRRTTGAGSWTEDKERLWGMLLEMSMGDEDGAAQRLLELTRNDAKGYRGYKDPAALSDKLVAWFLPKVEKELSLWYDRQAAAEDEGPPPATSSSPAPATGGPVTPNGPPTIAGGPAAGARPSDRYIKREPGAEG